jgi:hypothetical protein
MRGQISIDLILAVMFLIMISTIVFYNIFYSEGEILKSSKADRVYTIAECFENFVLTSYSKNTEITAKFEPIGDDTYIIYFKDKMVVVNTTRTVKFSPTENGVNVSGDIENSNVSMPNNTIYVEYRSSTNNKSFFVNKTVAVNIVS